MAAASRSALADWWAPRASAIAPEPTPTSRTRGASPPADTLESARYAALEEPLLVPQLVARLLVDDDLDVIYSAEGAGDNEEILYAALTLGNVTHKFYRFRDSSDGSVDYYDEEGKSAQKFLIRKPVATGRFSSGFGMRRHPILKRYRMHTGVDWAAPTGTPIMAAGNGTIEKIGTRAGYGASAAWCEPGSMRRAGSSGCTPPGRSTPAGPKSSVWRRPTSSSPLKPSA